LLYCKKTLPFIHCTKMESKNRFC